MKGRLFEGFRRFATLISRCDPFVRLTMRRAALIFAANRETANLVPRPYRSKVQILLATGRSDSEVAPAAVPVEKPAGFVILFVALLRPLKGGTLALKALQELLKTHPEAILVIIGSGSEGARMARVAAELGIAERVRFLGLLPRQQVLSWMQVGDVLLHPSLRDSAPMVLLEAMGQGKPVVCLDLGGPAEIIDDQCGFKVAPGNPAQVVSDLAAALGKLASSPSLRGKMGEAGRQRVRTHFDWEKRGQTMREIYRHVVAGGPRAPGARRDPD